MNGLNSQYFVTNNKIMALRRRKVLKQAVRILEFTTFYFTKLSTFFSVLSYTILYVNNRTQMICLFSFSLMERKERYLLMTEMIFLSAEFDAFSTMADGIYIFIIIYCHCCRNNYIIVICLFDY